MNDNQRELIASLLTKPREFWIRLAAAVLGGFFLLYLVLTFTIVIVDVKRHDGITEGISLHTVGLNRQDEGIFAIANLALVRRDTTSIRASAGQYQTIRSIIPPVIGFTGLTINIHKDRDVQKYSGDSLGCVAYDQDRDVVMSYSCGNPENLVRYDRPKSATGAWENKLVSRMTDDFPPIYSVKAFRNGVLGILQPPQSDQVVRDLLFYIDSTGNRQRFKLPDELDDKYISATSVITDGDASFDGSFLIVAKTAGMLFYGKIDGAQVNYKSYTIPNSYDPILDALHCTILATTAYCYSGEGSNHPDSAVEAVHRSKEKPGLVRIVDFSSEQANEKTYTMLKEIPVDGIHVTRAKNIYTYATNESIQGDLYKIDLSDKTATPRPYLSEITAFSTGNGLQFIRDNAVYKMDDATSESYLVFKSNHLRLSNILSFGDKTFINAYIDGVPDGKLHTYKILDHASDLPHGKRPVDVLPFYMAGTTLQMDYMDDFVKVRVFATATPDKASNRLIYNAGEYASNKIEIENELNNRGITSDKYQIVYSN